MLASAKKGHTVAFIGSTGSEINACQPYPNDFMDATQNHRAC